MAQEITFASLVLEAAANPQTRRFGRKAFIASVRETLGITDRVKFHANLLDAHRRGELVLGRADLVAAMDASLVASSEIVDGNSTYHFVVLP